MARTRVKICGITNLEDALAAVRLGADALGFIFVAASPRCITPEAARAIIDRLPPYVTPVAVTVNAPRPELDAIMARSGCQLAQVHGDEPPAYLDALPFPAVKAIAVADAADLAVLPCYPHARAFLLDTKKPGHYGGTGQTFDWGIIHAAPPIPQPIILAGGLTPDNIVEAIRIAHPYAVDVSSGVEREPGRKDHDKLAALFAAVAGC